MTIPDDQVDLPDVHEEVTALALAYEQALMDSDTAVLDGFFWNDPRLVRYGIADIQYGFEAVKAFRASLPQQSPQRVIERLDVRTFGRDYATVQIEFTYLHRAGGGRQSQTWARFDLPRHKGWRVVAAHVDVQRSG